MAGSNGDRSLERLSRFRLFYFFPRSFLLKYLKLCIFNHAAALKQAVEKNDRQNERNVIDEEKCQTVIY